MTGISNLVPWSLQFRIPLGGGADLLKTDIFICVNAAGDVKGGRFNANVSTTEVDISIGTLQPTGLPSLDLFTPPQGCESIPPP